MLGPGWVVGVGLDVYAAIDIAGGRAVRLRQGERSAERVVANDPLALAERFVAEGAPFLHVVDLDAAFGDGDNGETVARILAAVPCPVQVGGGVRSEARFCALRDAGAARVVVGTVAARDPALRARLLARDRDGVVVAADAHRGRVVVSGWTADGGDALASFAARMRTEGVKHLLVTAVERDGTGAGPDHAVLREALDRFGPGVIAAGGVGTVEDVVRLVPLAARGLAGVVVGSLLVDGRTSVAPLLQAASGLGVGGTLDARRSTLNRAGGR
jgi:phosphoribosylformimino-5-aminoimidazole carboxamide ribotide isomerase